MKKIVPYYAAKFFNDFILIYPVYTLLFQSRGQSESHIAWLLVIWALSAAVFEIPSGVLSDTQKRKHVLLASLLIKAGAFSLWIPNRGFLPIAGGFILWGLSEALASGTEEAWLYEILCDHNLEGRYARIRGRGTFMANLGIALSAPAGGILSRWGMVPVLWTSVLSVAVATVCVLFFDEPSRGPFAEEPGSTKGWRENLGIAAGEIIRHPQILRMVLFSAVIILMPGILDEWDALFLKELGFGTVFIGVWMSIRFIAESIGAAAAHRFEKLLNTITKLSLCAAVCGIPLIVLGITGFPLLLPFYGLMYLIFGALNILSESYIQKSISGEKRVTVLSIKSMLDNAIGMLLLLGMGYTAELFSFKLVLAAAGFYAAAGGVLFAILGRPRSRQAGKEVNPGE